MSEKRFRCEYAISGDCKIKQCEHYGIHEGGEWGYCVKDAFCEYGEGYFTCEDVPMCLSDKTIESTNEF